MKNNFFNYVKRVKIISSVILIVVATFGFLSTQTFADSSSINFEAPTYTTGSINGQDGWSSLGSASQGCAVYDHAVTNNTYGFPTFGGQSLRISNAVTSGCFSDQTFSKSLLNEAGETTADNGGMSGGTRQQHFEAQWDFASTVPGAEQPGLSVVASPDRGDGARMSWVQMDDTPTGLEVNFYDVQGTSNPANFVESNVVSGLDRTVPHTIKITMDFVEGDSNDVVNVYVDGVLKHTGTSWENYYRYDSEAATPGISRTADSILFRTGGTAAPATMGNGFVIDNLSLNSGPITTPTPTPTVTATPTPTMTPTPTPISNVLAKDTFIRSNQTFWGTASDGHIWGTDANTSNKFSISSNHGVISNGSTNYTGTLGPIITNAELLFSGKMSTFNNTNLGSVLRLTDENNWYKAYLEGDDLIIQKKVNGTTTTLASVPFNAANNTEYFVRFNVNGSTLSARAWKTTDIEPTSWMATATDTTFTSGHAGLRSLVQNSVIATYTSFLLTGTAANTTIGQDTFQRANQSHWGTASDGQTWTDDANSLSFFSINSNQGIVKNGSDNYNSILGSTVTDAEVLFTGKMSSYDSVSNLGSVIRFTDDNNYYKAYIDGHTLFIIKKVNGTLTNLNTTNFTANANTLYTLRFRVQGNTLSAKVWNTTNSEPTNWTITTTDSSLTSGFTGLRTHDENGITATYTSYLATGL